MEYKVNKRKLPRIKNDINNIRAIVLAVLNKFKVSPQLLEVSDSRFETYIDALLEAKVLLREKGTIGYQIESFIVFDEMKIDQYKKTNFYKVIESRIVPLFKSANVIKETLK